MQYACGVLCWAVGSLCHVLVDRLCSVLAWLVVLVHNCIGETVCTISLPNKMQEKNGMELLPFNKFNRFLEK